MAIGIAAVNSAALSDDKKEIVVQSTGKYIGALELRFASECVNDLARGARQREKRAAADARKRSPTDQFASELLLRSSRRFRKRKQPMRRPIQTRSASKFQRTARSRAAAAWSCSSSTIVSISKLVMHSLRMPPNSSQERS